MNVGAIFMSAFLLSGALAPHPGDAVLLKYRKYLTRQVRFYWGMDQKVSIFAAQIRQESNWNPKARSRYAAGLTQFTPATARWISGAYSELRTHGNKIDSRFDWKWSIRAMVLYDAHLYKRITASDPARRWTLTLRAYNGGLGWIKKEIKRCGALALNMECCLLFRKRAACAENLRYPAMILDRWLPLYERWDA